MWEKRYELNISQKNRLEKAADRLSTLRLLCFLAGAALTILAFSYAGKAAGFIILGLSVLSFIYLVDKHVKVLDQVHHFRKMAVVNQRCIQRLDGTWTTFTDNGEAFADDSHSYSADLDILGHASLFQWMNTANTCYGRKYFRDLLMNPDKQQDQIKKRQRAVKELSEKIDFCQALQCEGMETDDFGSDPENLFAYAESRKKIFPYPKLKYLFYILPVITILSFLFWYFNRSFPFIIPLSLLVLQMFINVLGSGKINEATGDIFTYKNKIAVYHDLLKILEEENFSSEDLLELQLKVIQPHTASDQINQLEKIVDRVSFKLTPLFYFPLNQLLFWGYHCAFALEKWKEQTGPSLREWVITIGKMEALVSLAAVAQIHPEYVYPEFDETRLSVSAEEMGHPLISGQTRVDNHLELVNQIAVVTGSNMSGKTTLLRTVGVNLVLAYAGAPVCAKHFTCAIMEIYTSMRISDDLNSGISTFYAELLRIKMIVDYGKKHHPMIFLIDEVFRGTNSEDRLTGAQNVLMNLNREWIIGLISTHDLDLCEFENAPGKRIINYHFTETYCNNEIHFDYKLRRGRSQTRNARYLMKMVGIDLIE